MAENNIKAGRHGGISVETEHIFPIIKKWLYSEKEIFLREVVSNACDAITKLKRLSSLGEAHDIGDNFRIDVSFNKTAGTLTVSDNGIGMTEEELDRYICKIALSGALEFVQKYEGDNAGADGIIGHFGLGFYSVFMVSERVEVITRSYTGAPAVRMVCGESGEYDITDAERERGTTVIMHLSKEGEEFCSEYKLREVLGRYCAFMPVEIYLTDEEKELEDKAKAEDSKDEGVIEEPKPVNDTHPLWQKKPADCTEDEYKEFYRKVFSDWRDPLFYVHINADYPLNFKGIIYFPRLSGKYESIEGKVKLYYNQVFVADNIKEVIPEYLMMLRGVIDCPELPLNVSRSYLQNSAYVKKVSEHITKKVADKLNAMFANEREKYEGIWKDIKAFVEYGCMYDTKFCDRVRPSLLLETTSGKYKTIDEYLEGARESHEGKIFYASDKAVQAQYISMYESQGCEIALLDSVIDTQFISSIEGKDDKIKFIRVDADTSAIGGEEESENAEKLEKLFREASGCGDKLKIRVEKFKSGDVPALLNVSEEARRMDDFMKFYSMDGESESTASPDATLVLNSANAIISRLASDGYGESSARVAKQIYTLATIAQRRLSAEEMKSFLADSYSIIESL